MKNLAPKIVRQRLLIEGFYNINVNRAAIKMYFDGITQALKLRMYGKPIIFSPGEKGKKINQGYDAFVPLIDSGISVYVWGNAKFVSVVLYTCRGFNEKIALKETKDFFKINEVAYKSF